MATKPFSRRKPFRNLKESFLIICEGKNTERFYFESFKLATATIKVLPISDKGGNALLFVEKSLQYIENFQKKYDNYWLVFDKDENKNDNFNKALELIN